jgi:hypothetical protein
MSDASAHPDRPAEADEHEVLDELRPEVNQDRVADALPGDPADDEPDGTEVTGQAG